MAELTREQCDEVVLDRVTSARVASPSGLDVVDATETMQEIEQGIQRVTGRPAYVPTELDALLINGEPIDVIQQQIWEALQRTMQPA